MAITQWVNLPKDQAFVEDDIKSIKRLGSFKLRGKFKTKDLANFKIRLVADGNKNIVYSTNEIARWSRYKKIPMPLTAQLNDSGDEVIYEQEFELPAAGGNCYKVEAKYNDKVVITSRQIKTARKMFFEVIPMNGINSPSKNDLEAELKKVFDVSDINISCKEIGGRSNTLSRIKTIMNDAHYNLIDSELGRKIASTDHIPYVIPIAFVDYIASYKSLTIEQDIEIGLKQKLLSFIGKEDIILTVKIKGSSGQNEYLFYNFDDDFDRNRSWLEAGSVIEDSNGRSVGTISNDSVVDQNLTEIKFKVTTTLANFLSRKKGKIKINVKAIDSVSNGYAWNGKVVVALKTLADIDANRTYKNIVDYMETIKHEFGHVFKQASTGDCTHPINPGSNPITFLDESAPDSHPDLYGQYHKDCGSQTNSYGHQGPHCKCGATYDLTTGEWSSTPGQDLCVMLGASGIGQRKQFCPNCKKTLRKADLSK